MKKQAEILQSRYYDGRKHQWNENAFEKPDDPTPERIRYWVTEWEKTYGYPQQESALQKLFQTLCPENKSLDDILIKVCTLNDFYSTNIYKVFDVAQVILKMNVDERLKSSKRDTSIVDEMVAEVKRITGRSVYSFATKYCSHHKPELYPIYDSYVDILLRYYRDHNTKGFCFADKDLQHYASFCKVEQRFAECYGLNLPEFTAKEIDKFLWQVGKKCFPKWEIIDTDKANNQQQAATEVQIDEPYIRASDIIRAKLFADGGRAIVHTARGLPCKIIASPDGRTFTAEKLPIKPPLAYEVFDVITALLMNSGGRARKGNGRNSRLGDPECDETTVVGAIGYHYFGKKTGDSLFDPVFVLAAVMEWAGIAYNGRGELNLTASFRSRIE